MTTAHPHAEVLRAIADGVPLSEFEVRLARDFNVAWFEPISGHFLVEPSMWQVRRKPRTHVVNGFTVPAPMDTTTAPNSVLTVFWPFLTYESLWDSASPSHTQAKLAIQRGLAHTTKEAAIANAKAMLKIDPEAA